jgi:hypothetical protein
MGRCCVALAALFLVVVSASHGRSEDPSRIDELIKQLDAEDFKVREAASQQLVEIGLPALPKLEAAKASDQNAETRLRAADAIRAIDRKLIHERPAALAEIIQTAFPTEGDVDTERLDVLLARLVEVISEDTELKFKLPVGASNLPKSSVVAGSQRGVIATLEFGKVLTSTSSVIIARSAVDLSTATNSIIIARDYVNVRTVNNSLIICGGDIKAARTNGSVLLAGNAIETTTSTNPSVLAAGRRVQTVGVTSDIFLKTVPAGDNPATDDPRKAVPCDQLILDFPELALPLTKLLKPTSIFTLEGGVVLFRREGGDGEYVARLGKDLVAPDGQPFPELKGWQLAYCAAGFAVFKRGEESTVVFISSP